MSAKDWPYKPNIIQIECVQGCNRHCTFCGTAGIERKLHFVGPETIKHTCKLIREAGLTSRILLAGHGEPTLHPHIVKIIQIIRKELPENTIHLFTNGLRIQQHPEMVVNLFTSGLNDLVFDEYSDSRIGAFVRTDSICDRYTIVEQQEGVPLFANKNSQEQRICIVPPIDEEENTINRKIENHCGAGGKKLEKPYQQLCSTIFRDIFIRYDGNIAICCNDFRGEYYVTNIHKCKKFEEAWLHERLESARKFIMSKDRSAVYPCSICNTKPIRAGLLPDARGQLTLPKPTDLDRLIVSKKYPPLATIRKREWEQLEPEARTARKEVGHEYADNCRTPRR